MNFDADLIENIASMLADPGLDTDEMNYRLRAPELKERLHDCFMENIIIGLFAEKLKDQGVTKNDGSQSPLL